MGNRFGRNQKRRMREELAAKSAQIIEGERKLKHNTGFLNRKIIALSEDIQIYRETVQLTEKVLGSFFASLPEKKIQAARKKGHDIIGWLEMYPPVPNFSGTIESCIAANIRAIDIIKMALLEGEAWAEEARSIVHARYYFADGQAAYSVSKQALRHLPKDHLEQTVMKECAELLVSGLAKRGHR